MSLKTKRQNKVLRQRRVRAVVKGTSERPRLSVFRSNRRLSAQIIDDVRGVTMAAASDRDLPRGRRSKALLPRERARAVGGLIAQRAKAARITAVRFDRGGYAYHGLVAALAEGARQDGLKF